MAQAYATREEYLNAFIDKARVKFAEINAQIPYNVRVAVGFTSKGYKGSVIGECWSDSASESGHYEIFVKPTLNNVARVCGVLTHELIHCAIGLDKGHNAAFKRVATDLGLTGKMTATVEGPDWFKWALPIIAELGELPYAALSADGMSTGRKKQKTNLRKVECPECGWLARVTSKHIDGHDVLLCPVPDCGGNLVAD